MYFHKSNIHFSLFSCDLSKYNFYNHCSDWRSSYWHSKQEHKKLWNLLVDDNWSGICGGSHFLLEGFSIFPFGGYTERMLSALKNKVHQSEQQNETGNGTKYRKYLYTFWSHAFHIHVGATNLLCKIICFHSFISITQQIFKYIYGSK